MSRCRLFVGRWRAGFPFRSSPGHSSCNTWGRRGWSRAFRSGPKFGRHIGFWLVLLFRSLAATVGPAVAFVCWEVAWGVSPAHFTRVTRPRRFRPARLETADSQWPKVRAVHRFLAGAAVSVVGGHRWSRSGVCLLGGGVGGFPCALHPGNSPATFRDGAVGDGRFAVAQSSGRTLVIREGLV